MRVSNFLAGFAAMALIAVGSATPLVAFPQFRTAFEEKYGADNKVLVNYTCNVCHMDGGGIGWNPYGKLIRDTGEFSPIPFEDFESIDSDGDGMTNGQEILADIDGVHPGRTSENVLVAYLLGTITLNSPTLVDASPELIVTGEVNGDGILDCGDIIETQKVVDRNFGELTDRQNEAIRAFLLK